MTDVLSYKSLSDIEHVLARGSMYGAGLEFVKRKDQYVANEKNGDISCKLITLKISDAIERIFLEPLSNAGDNVERSREAKIDPGVIRVNIKNDEITIYNEGSSIPIEIHPEEKVYVPEMIFSKLRTGSNFNDDEKNMLIGQNGIGIKLTNIFSKEFIVDIGNNNKKYMQRFYNNMFNKDMEIILPYKGKNYTKITYKADLERLYGSEFTLKNEKGYTDEIISLYRKYAIDVAFSCNIPVFFNDVEICIRNIKEYTNYFMKNVEYEHEPVIIDYKDSQLCLYDASNNNRSISICNGVNTKRGGMHVESWIKAISRPFIDHFKKKKKNLTTDMVKKNIIIFLSCRVPNPKYSSQSKELLTSPKVPTNVSKKDETTLLTWNIMERLTSILDTKDEINMKKIDGKKTTYIDDTDVDDANEAGNRNSFKCAIFITEGKSAKTTAIKGIKYLKGGRDLYGALPIRGKFINVKSYTLAKVAKNKEVQLLKKVLALREGVDYEDDKEFNTLRYGSVIIFADADVDGIHIRGLVMNFFMSLYPSLVKRGYVKVMLSPIIKVQKGKNKLEFSNLAEYNNWKNSESGYETWNHKYYKGLGTHNKEGVESMFRNPIIFPYPYDELAQESMNMAFGKDIDKSDLRKEWLESFDPTKEQTVWKDATITSFVQEELIEYSFETIQRAIPLYMDGLKESQRKIVYIMIKKYFQFERIEPLSGAILSKTNYHHGAASLQGAIVKMAQTFPGSNNIPLLEGDGEFGSILEGGDDSASARYISAKIAPITKWIIRKEDNCILKYRMDEGKQIEPYEYYPIVPMLIINGSNGIAVAWSTNIPCYNPEDIIIWIKRWLNNMKKRKKDKNTVFVETEKIELVPWYKDYNGLIYKNNKGDIINEGIFELKSDRIIYVKALPVTKSIIKYKEELHKMKENNKIVGYRSLSDQDNTDIRVIGMKNPTITKLKLRSKICISNFTMIDKNGKPFKFRTINEFLNYFCTNRLVKYEERKYFRTMALKKLLKEKSLFLSFIQDVIDGVLLISNKVDKELIIEMKKKKYPESFLDKSIRMLTEKKRDSLKNEIDGIENEIKIYSKFDPVDLWLNELKELETHL